MDGRQGTDREKGTEAQRALQDALDLYLRGSADLESAARSAGMDTFDFLQEAGSLPDPAAIEGGNDLPTFVRGRDDQR